MEAVRQMWAEEVNRQLTQAHRPERVDHRSLAMQRQEAIQKGEVEKAAELDREPQVKLGWKVVQMERRGVSSDRGNQLRQVRADNAQRKAEVVDIGQLRAQLIQRREEEAAHRLEAERKRVLEEIEAVFRGKGPVHREATLKRWRYLDTREVPEVVNARALWEQDQRDPDANAWRETRKTIEWEAGQVAQERRGDRGVAAQSIPSRHGLSAPG